MGCRTVSNCYKTGIRIMFLPCLCFCCSNPQARPDNNSVVAFKDNSSAIRGFKVRPLLPLNPGGPSALAPQGRDWDLLLTAETHNFPCAVAPYPGGLVADWLAV